MGHCFTFLRRTATFVAIRARCKAWSAPIAASLLSLWMPGRSVAQDLHFSQFYLHPIALNPAATGVFEGDLRFAGAYRSQWQQVPVRYNSFVAAADWKALRRNTNLLSAGMALQHDFAGDAGLSWSQVMMTAAVTQAIGENQAIGVGFGVGVAQRAFDLSALTFKNQWTGDVFDPSRPSKEALRNSTGVVPTLAAGVNWHWSAADTRTHFNVGAGAMHLNRPKFSFEAGSANRLPLWLTVNAAGGVQVAEKWDAVGYAAFQHMAEAREVLVGGGARLILSTGPANFTALQVSLGLRGKDAWIPALQIERNAWTVGLSYDINTSPFEVATNRRGGFELAVVYRRVPVAEVKTVKSCPIF